MGSGALMSGVAALLVCYALYEQHLPVCFTQPTTSLVFCAVSIQPYASCPGFTALRHHIVHLTDCKLCCTILCTLGGFYCVGTLAYLQ